jgi:hypothetical protein
MTRVVFPREVEPARNRLATAALRRRVLRWLKFAGRPMTQSELCSNCAIKAEPMRELLAGMVDVGLLAAEPGTFEHHGRVWETTVYRMAKQDT